MPISARPVDLLDHFREALPAMLDLTADLARMDTPTGDAPALERFAARYAALLEESGARPRAIPSAAGPHLAAEAGSAVPGARPVLVVGHMDTVWGRGEAERRPPAIRDGRLHGPGVLDMKASLAVLVFVLRRLLRDGVPRRVAVFLSADEEAGSLSARPHLEAMARGEDTVALVVEPPLPDGGLKLERKGVGIYRLEAAGRAAHAGIDPDRGASAIEALARACAEIASWKDPARGIGTNIGRIGGGISSNVVPDRAWAEIDIRFRRAADGEEVDRRLRSLRPAVAGTRFSVEGGIVFPPMTPSPASLALAEAARRLGETVGLTLTAGGSGGGSDGSFLASRGVPTLDGLGVDGAGAHASDEHIVVERVAPRAALLALLIRSAGMP